MEGISEQTKAAILEKCKWHKWKPSSERYTFRATQMKALEEILNSLPENEGKRIDDMVLMEIWEYLEKFYDTSELKTVIAKRLYDEYLAWHKEQMLDFKGTLPMSFGRWLDSREEGE